MARRPAPLHQRQPAILLARRSPLPRSPRAARHADGGRAGAKRADSGRRRRPGRARSAEIPASKGHHPGRPRPANDRHLPHLRRIKPPQRRLARQPQSARGERRRRQMAGAGAGKVQRHHHRPARPLQLLAGQALFRAHVSAGGAASRTRRQNRGAIHLALFRPECLLVGGGHAGGRRARHRALSCICALLRRMGFRLGRP